MNPGQTAWSKSEHRRLRGLYPIMRTPQLAVLLGRTTKAVAARAKILGVQKNLGNGGRRKWSPAEDRWLRATYPNISTVSIAKKMHVPIFTVYQRAKKLGLGKSTAYKLERKREDAARITRSGVAHRFPKGQVPANKGLRRPGYAPGRMAQTQFKKGQICRNAMPMWSFRWCDGYLMLKTGRVHKPPCSGWEYVHRLIWEQANGPLPDWKVARIWWKDGDHGNCSFSNLELVPSAEHVRRTTIHRLPKELVQVIQLTGALKRKIRNREKKQIEKHDGRSAESPVRCA